MVSPIISDTLIDPSKEITELYKSRNSTQADVVEVVEQHFRELLSPQDAFLEIPPLSISHPPPNHRKRRLIRFMGMVQDTSAFPEVYLSVLEDGSCGGWGIYENSSQSQNNENAEPGTIDYSKLRERDSVWAVTVPGQTRWTEQEFAGPEFESATPSDSYTCPKRHKCASDDAGAFGLYLKLYGGHHLKPGEVKTFIGIFDEQVEEQDEENNDVNPVSIPILHVIFTLDTPPTDRFNVQDLRASLPSVHTDMRDELIQWIADEGLGGDKTAATWLLLLNLGKVQSRSPPIFPPTLTVSAFPDAPSGAPPIPAIFSILKMILSRVSTIPLTLDNLNKRLFVPTSLEEDLHAGVLQHPDGTFMIVTESGMTEGKVTEKGLKNLDALQSAMATQTLPYVFPYSSFPFAIDLGFVVLTRGQKSAFLKTDSVLPLKGTVPVEDLAKALYKSEKDIKIPSPSKLRAFQDYISVCKRASVSVTSEMGKYIEDEFVRIRRESVGNLSSDDLARRMSIAKLLSASLLETNMTKETWEAANLLDKESERK